MAKTKTMKQLDALERWDQQLQSGYLQKYHPKHVKYVQSQITILIQKLNDKGHKVGIICAMCGLGVYGSQDVICPQCRRGFQGVEIAVTNLSVALENIGLAASAAADRMTRSLSTMARNSTYGLPGSKG